MKNKNRGIVYKSPVCFQINHKAKRACGIDLMEKNILDFGNH